eukprot:NODE_20728_length_784_cov_4.024353.p3 GENE.NODE_20728_length_784_cov_4.024353~~NODE_20728_length_784_cov_4.024353.p3  ORF type:complete len:67 (-),score=15.13 NODE_20728_length_784_cov_4.024353:205-405(-)
MGRYISPSVFVHEPSGSMAGLLLSRGGAVDAEALAEALAEAPAGKAVADGRTPSPSRQLCRRRAFV